MESSPLKRHSVLLVEDDDGHAELISEAFSADGPSWDLWHVGSVSAAMEAIEASTPDAVVSDLRLPDGEGTSLLASDLELCCPVIIMTSFGDEAIAVGAMKGGAADYVVKSPSAFEEMPRRVRSLLDEHRRELERLRLERQVQQARKMEAIGQLAGGIAHDFNNHLTCIMGFCQMARRNLDDVEKLDRYLGTILETSTKAADLTTQLLGFSRSSVRRHVPVDIGRVLRTVGGLLEHTLERYISLDVEIGEGPVVAKGDPSHLQSALLNLAINARDAMPDGGTLTLSVTSSFADMPRDDGETLGGPIPVVVVEVRDSGTGMEPATVERIFEPFFTTKQMGHGTGLGLSSVLTIVQEHHGIIDVDTEPGQGSTFRIVLPKAQEAVVTPTREVPAMAMGQGTILVVDDEAAIRNLVSALLERLGYSVTVAKDGAEALAKVDEWLLDGQLPDLVLLDMIMPGMKGEDVLYDLWRRAPDIQVVIVSGYAPSDKVNQEIEAGRIGFLPKPFELEALSRIVGERLSSTVSSVEETLVS